MGIRPTLTVAVLTMNEAERIGACLASAAFADQLLVVDSGSTDDTVAIAQKMGAEVHLYPDWQGFAEQRNRLLAHARGDYIFFLDADEVMRPDFQQELQAIVASGERAVWRIRWRMVAFAKELKYLRSTSVVERLFVRETLTGFTGVVHEQAQLSDAGLARHTISAPLLHYARPSVQESLQKLSQYAALGAAKRAGKKGGIWRGLFSGSSMFVRLYIFHGGVLCGGAGFLYCLFIALEGFFRYAILGYDRQFNAQAKRG